MKELTEKESVEVNGGSILMATAIFFATSLAYDIISNAPDSAKSFSEGYQRGLNTFN